MDWLMFGLAWLGVSFGFGLGWMARNGLGPSEEWRHTYLTGIMTLFHEGERAYESGKEEFDNPYLDGYEFTPEARAWAFGYNWKENRK